MKALSGGHNNVKTVAAEIRKFLHQSNINLASKLSLSKS